MKRLNLLLIFITFILLPSFGGVGGGPGGPGDFQRLKGYYRVYQTTDSVLTYFWDGYMEIYVPLDTAREEKTNDFCDRKFLGERRRKARNANGDDLFVQINLPNLEATPLKESYSGDEYSTRNNGDIYFLKYKAGHVSKNDSTETVTFDELAGRPDHSLDMSQLKMYGVVATLTEFDESETRYLKNNDLVSFGKRLSYNAHYKGEDEDERIVVTTDFFVTARQVITKDEMKKIKKEKNHIWEFNIPSNIPQLPADIAEAWSQLVEY